MSEFDDLFDRVCNFKATKFPGYYQVEGYTAIQLVDDLWQKSRDLRAENASLREELDKARERERWIPVGERLPEIDPNYNFLSVTVLALTKTGNQINAYFDHKDKTWNTPFPYRVSVTHWKPLLELPQE